MYTDICNQSDYETFVKKVNYLHDGILREFSLISRGYVDTDRRMFGDAEPSDARMIIQLQSVKTPCVEIVFESVTDVKIAPNVVFRPVGEIKKDKIVFYVGGYKLKNQIRISSKSFKYRILNEKCLGRDLKTVAEIAVGELRSAIKVENSYIQCPNCLNIWNIQKVEEFVRCPDCKILLIANV